MGNIFKDKTLIGITGGIGSGKSEVCRMFSARGYKVIFADLYAKELYKKDKTLAKKVIKAFGKEILNYKGVISLAKLREVVFANKKNFVKINDIVHPTVIKYLMNDIKSLKQKVIIIESALVYDTEFFKYLDWVVMVYSNKTNRLKRIMMRDGAKKKDVEKIMSFQIDEKKKMKAADFIIENNKQVKDLEANVEFLCKFLKLL